MDKPRDKGLDFSQKWQRHLREATKTTVARPCQYSKDRKIFPSEEELKIHVRDIHSEEITHHHEDLEAKHELHTQTLPSANRDRPRPPKSMPANPAPLTATGLQTLGDKLKAETNDKSEPSTGHALGSRSIKKYFDPRPLMGSLGSGEDEETCMDLPMDSEEETDQQCVGEVLFRTKSGQSGVPVTEFMFGYTTQSWFERTGLLLDEESCYLDGTEIPETPPP